MSIEIGEGLTPEERNELVKKLYEHMGANKQSIFGKEVSEVSIVPKYLPTEPKAQTEKRSPSKNIISLEYYMTLHHGGYAYPRSPGIFKNNDLLWKMRRTVDNSLVKTEIEVNKSKGIPYVKTSLDNEHDLLIYFEGEVDELDGRGYLYQHVVLIPKGLRIPIEKVPFIKPKEAHKMYESFGPKFPTLEVEVE